MLKSMTDMKSTFKTIFLVAAAALSAAGCTGDGSRALRMSREEKALIEGPGIMRVLTVDNREDSLVLRAGCSDFRIRDLKSETFRILSGRMNVIRSQKIIIRYTDPETIETVRDTVEGYTAVIFQHEADHLDGILFTDKVVNTGPGQ